MVSMCCDRWKLIMTKFKQLTQWGFHCPSPTPQQQILMQVQRNTGGNTGIGFILNQTWNVSNKSNQETANAVFICMFSIYTQKALTRKMTKQIKVWNTLHINCNDIKNWRKTHFRPNNQITDWTAALVGTAWVYINKVQFASEEQ